MNKATLSALAAFAVAGTAFAGPAKDFKQPVASTPFFQDTEIALDAFYSFNDGQHKDSTFSPCGLVLQPQYLNDGSGGGVGANFFFARYFGVGVEGNWWNGAKDGRSLDDCRAQIRNGKSREDLASYKFDKSVAQQYTGNVILRYPLEFKSFGLAPYLLAGGGVITDGSTAGFGDVGAGVEVRLTPHVGVFSDWRWNFVGGSDKNDVNTTRAGVRFVF